MAIGQLATSREYALALADLGAISVVLSGMQAGAKRPALQANGLMAISNLVLGDRGASDGERCDMAVEDGALELCVLALSHHPTHDGVLHWGATAILRLTHESAERAREAIDAGAMKALRAAAAHPSTQDQPAIAAKVELAVRWLETHQKSSESGGVVSKAEAVFRALVWEQGARGDADLPAATTLAMSAAAS